MSYKSFGQIAYEGYCEAVEANLMSWEELPDSVKEVWEKSAKAVVEEVVPF